jgi:hypothetical protein
MFPDFNKRLSYESWAASDKITAPLPDPFRRDPFRKSHFLPSSAYQKPPSACLWPHEPAPGLPGLKGHEFYRSILGVNGRTLIPMILSKRCKKDIKNITPTLPSPLRG